MHRSGREVVVVCFLGSKTVGGREGFVARQHANDDGVQPTRVDFIALKHERRSTVGRSGTSRLTEIYPPNSSFGCWTNP
jgi:hypothetical protein